MLAFFLSSYFTIFIDLSKNPRTSLFTKPSKITHCNSKQSIHSLSWIFWWYNDVNFMTIDSTGSAIVRAPKSIKPVLRKPILSPFRKTSIIKEAILRETKEHFRSLDTKSTFRRRLKKTGMVGGRRDESTCQLNPWEYLTLQDESNLSDLHNIV